MKTTVFVVSGRVSNVEYKLNGSIILEINDYFIKNKDFIIEDQELRHRLISYVGSEANDVQNVEDIKKIIETAKNSNGLVAVFFVKFQVHTFVEVHPSVVPTFAYDFYYHRLTSEKMKEDILHIVTKINQMISTNSENMEKLDGSLFVFFNGEWDKDIWESINDVFEKYGNLENVQLLRFGRPDTTQKYHRITSLKYTRFPELWNELKVSAQFYVEGGSGEPITVECMLDTGASDTSFPGVYDKTNRKAILLSGVEFTAPYYPTTVNTAGNDFQAVRIINKFMIKIGDLDPVEVSSLISKDGIPIEEFRQKVVRGDEEILIGRDILFQLSVNWSRIDESSLYMNIENGYKCKSKPESTFSNLSSKVKNAWNLFSNK